MICLKSTNGEIIQISLPVLALLIDKIYASGEIFAAYNEELLGYCAFYLNDFSNKEGYISLICVGKKFQNRHIGQRLLDTVYNRAIEKGMRTLRLEVRQE